MLWEGKVGEGRNALDLRLLLSAIASGKTRRALIMVREDKRRDDRLFPLQLILVAFVDGKEKECAQATIASPIIAGSQKRSARVVAMLTHARADAKTS